MQYKHIIWDWNGTLLDDAWLCIEIMNAQAAKRNLPKMTPARYADIFRFPVSEYYAEIGFDFSVEPFENVSTEFITAYYRRVPECQLRPEGVALLADMQAAGVSQTILSASQQASLQIQVERHGVSQFFDAVNGLSDHHAHGKAEIALAWMAAAEIDPATIVFIGDTLHDLAVARALEVDCVLLESGHQSRERLLAGGVPVLANLNEFSF